MGMEIAKKHLMWKKELERQDASMGVMHVFDSMMNEIGESHNELHELQEQNNQLQNRIDELEKYVDDNEKYKTKWLTLNSWIVTQEESIKPQTIIHFGSDGLSSGMSITAIDDKFDPENDPDYSYDLIRNSTGMSEEEKKEYFSKLVSNNHDDVPVGGLKEDE